MPGYQTEHVTEDGDFLGGSLGEGVPQVSGFGVVGDRLEEAPVDDRIIDHRRSDEIGPGLGARRALINGAGLPARPSPERPP